MRLRVCILARENILHWAPFYIEAFRERCDVITVGPALDRERLELLKCPHLAAYAVPNDIVTDCSDLSVIVGLLPQGWRPDLVVAIQSGGVSYENAAQLACPTAYISVDTWHDPQEFIAARHYDFVFVAQKVFVPYLRQNGCRWVYWLPLACAPAHHRPVPAEEEFDIVFVGATRYVVDEERVQRLRRLAAHFEVGQQEGVLSDEMCLSFCRGRLGFNSSIAQDVNMRVFEVLAMGRPLLTNRDAAVNGLFELFEDGQHLFTYDDTDLVGRARACLGNPEICHAVAQRGRQEVLAKHTYGHRVETLLDTVRGHVPGLGGAGGALLRDGGTLLTYLPHGSRQAIDIGLGVERSKVALRRVGVERFIGIAREAAPARRRGKSYDEVLTWPVEQALEADTVFWTAPCGYSSDLTEAVRWAHGVLCEGGTLVLRLRADEVEASGLGLSFQHWDNWLYAQGFHLLIYWAASIGEGWSIFSTRKYTRSRLEITAELYRRFPGGELSSRRPAGAALNPARGGGPD